MDIFQVLLLIIAALAGAVAAKLLLHTTHTEWLSILLSFSGAYLLGVVVLHLLPEVFENGNSNIAVFILLGFFIQFLLVQFTRGIEHGHMHVSEHISDSYVFGVLFGLSVHAFMEGIPLSAGALSQGQLQPLFWAICIHKIPETFALSTVLLFSAKKPARIYLLIAFFSLMTPLGFFAGKYIAMENPDMNINWLLAIVCGSLIHISTTIIFESGGKMHKISVMKLSAILAGLLIAVLTMGF